MAQLVQPVRIWIRSPACGDCWKLWSVNWRPELCLGCPERRIVTVPEGAAEQSQGAVCP
jgi:TPP-dependent indolepyruvate ferredoxin oxidoreductase alpha subunit